METTEKIINILKQNEAFEMTSALSPELLIEKCVESGISDLSHIESAVIELIDQDLVEYEMDDSTKVTHIWLL